MEDDRQSATVAVGAGRLRSRCWAAGLCRSPPRDVERVHPRDDRDYPPSCPFSSGSFRDGSGFRSGSTCGRSVSDLKLALSQIALLVTFLAHQAWLMCDAICATLFRLYRVASDAARMDYGRPGESRAPARFDRLLPADGRRHRPRCRCGDFRGVGRAAFLAGRGAVRDSLARCRRSSRAGSACRRLDRLTRRSPSRTGKSYA